MKKRAKIIKNWKTPQVKLTSVSLRPSRTVQTFMFSTPSRLVGEYESDGILLTHAFGDIYEQSLEGPFSRSYYILSYEVPDPYKDYKGGVIRLPNYSSEFFLICLSVLFGKRFDDNGSIQSHGRFRLPEIGVYPPMSSYQVGYHSHAPRANISVPLNLEHFEIMNPILTNKDLNNKAIDTFSAAGGFYLQALQGADGDPEGAYLNLITCGEILSNYYSYTEDQLYDLTLLGQLSLIEKYVPNGDSVVRSLKSRLYQVKRKFTFALLNLLDPEFFTSNEIDPAIPNGALSSTTIEKAIKAAYDIRSTYVHTGKAFGTYIKGRASEMPTGAWVSDDPEMRGFLKALNAAPTLKGLERIMRFCLLRFLETNQVITLPKFS